MKKIKFWIYKWAVKIIVKRIINSETSLTPDYLLKRGWVTEYDSIRQKEFWIEPGLKDRDRIYVEFERGIYRVWHSVDKTFIACERSLEWFEMHFILAHPDNYNKVLNK